MANARIWERWRLIEKQVIILVHIYFLFCTLSVVIMIFWSLPVSHNCCGFYIAEAVVLHPILSRKLDK